MTKQWVLRVGLVALSVVTCAPHVVSVASVRPVRPVTPVNVGPVVAAPAPRVAVPPPGQSTGQSATRLADGRWLVVGGEGVEGTAVVWDGQAATPTPGAAPVPRAFHSATVLADGRVLIAGGRHAGALVDTVEIFDPATGGFVPIAIDGAAVRAGHTATLLTDGRVLVAGGTIDGSTDAGSTPPTEVWDVQAQTVAPIAGGAIGRTGHRATLLPDGRVLFEGGVGANGVVRTDADVFDVATQQTGTMINVPAPGMDARPPQLMASVPATGATDVPLDVAIALRFSQPLRADGVTPQTIGLTGPDGPVEVALVAAEDGRLVFVRPRGALTPDTTYRVTIDGAIDARGVPVARASIRLTTRRVADPTPASDPEAWTPASATHGWRSERARSPWETLAPLQAPAGQTAVSGRVLRLDGRPLAAVTLRLAGQTTRTDRTGRFLLPATGGGKGGQTLVIDARTANAPGRTYGLYEALIYVRAGQTNVLPFTIWSPLIDTAHQVTIPSPTLAETVITTPTMPGLELHLPAGTVIRDDAGTVIRTLSLTPIPLDRTPFPMPEEAAFTMFFTIQPGGAYLSTPGPIKGAWLVYPRNGQSRAGKRVQFFNYDPDSIGWFPYGMGTVTATQVVPDQTTRFYGFTGASFNDGQAPPPPGSPPGNSCGCDGDPVDLTTGIFTQETTDLALPDVMPLALTRTYNSQDTDPTSPRSFGIGTTHNYAIFLHSENLLTEADFILPTGGRVHYVKHPDSGPNWWETILEHTASPTAFYKSRITFWGAPGGVGGWQLALTDGTLYIFGHGAPLQAIRDRYGNETRFTWSSTTFLGSPTGNLLRVTSPNGRWIDLTYYAGTSRIYQAKDLIGRTVTYTYDGSGRLGTVTDPENHVTSYTYDAQNRMLTVKPPHLQGTATNLVTNEYTTVSDAPTPVGWVKRQTHADGGVFQFAYTFTAGKISRTDVTDPTNIIRRVTFNADGYILDDVRAFGTANQRTDATTRQSGTNLVTSVTGADGSQTSTTYDGLGNIASVTRHAGTGDAATTSLTYDPKFNQLATITDALNHTITLEFDERGNRQSIIDALNHKTSFEFDASGRITTITDPLQHATHVEYAGSDIVAITDPLGRTKRRFVDGAGRTVTETDPAGRTTKYVYDKVNHVVQRTDPTGALTAYGYDGAGRLSTVSDALNHVTSYAYDTMARVVTRTDPMGGIETFIHDLNGNLAGRIDRKGQATAYDYDGLNRVSRITYADDSTVDYTYDALDRASTIADSLNGSVIRTYDGRDRLASETTPLQTVTYTYDVADRRDTMALTGQPTVTYGYDAADRLTTVTQNGATVVIAYDDANRRTLVTFPGGPQMEYTYDAASQVTGLTYRNASTTLGTLTYGYDLAGRRTEVGGSWARTVLPQPVASATYDAANRAVSWGGASLFFDPNGNLISKGTQSFTWNSRDQLSGVIGELAQTLTYDAAGRRATTVGGSATTSFQYDRWNILRQATSGGTAIDRVIGTEVDDTFIETAGVTRALFVDALGSTVARVDTAGSVQQAFAYGPFGAAIATGATEEGLARFTGREDEGTGLLAFRSRYYDPELGRFISEDRVGIVGGANLYAYADDNPVQQADPFGTSPTWPPTWSTPKVPFGLKLRCEPGDACALLAAKAAVYTGLISVHTAWDVAFWPGRHTKEIADFGRGLARCNQFWDAQCKCDPPKIRPPTPAEVSHMQQLFAFGSILALMLLAALAVA